METTTMGYVGSIGFRARELKFNNYIGEALSFTIHAHYGILI